MTRRFAKLGWLVLLAALPGCATGPFARSPAGGNAPVMTQTPKPDQVIAHLNQNAQRINSIEYSDVSITAKQGLQFVGVNGMMAYAKPKNFRLMASALNTTQADVGSNEQEFWFMFKQGGSTLYRCSYEDYPRVRSLPLPVHPDWISEALCAQEMTAETQYQTQVQGNKMLFVAQSSSPQGQPQQKTTTVALSGPLAGRVVSHSVRNEQGAEVWTADILEYQVISGAVIPKRVTVRCPSEKMELKFTLNGAAVNTVNPEQNTLTFKRPRGYTEVDLARGPAASPTSVQRVRGNAP